MPNNTPSISAIRDDITTLRVDAIVNAANSSLLGGGGVDGAIHRAGGVAILDACRQIRTQNGPLPPGEAVATTAGNLHAKHVIHTVGPVWRGGTNQEVETLSRCYVSALDCAAALSAESIAFPAISCGVYRFPVALATQTAVRSVQLWKDNNASHPIDVVFCCFTLEVWHAYQSILKVP